MIVYLKNSEIEREQWDNCIRHTSGAKPYACSWFLDIVSPGWEALVDDEYDSVFPLPVASRLGIKYLITPRLVQQLGVYSPDKPAPLMLREFLDYMPALYRSVDLCIAHYTDCHGFNVEEKTNYELHLSRPYDGLEESFTPACRRYITSSASRKYEIFRDLTPEEMTALFLTGIKYNRSDLTKNDLLRLTELMHFCISTKKGSLVGMRLPGRHTVYGLFLVNVHGFLTILLEANTRESIVKHLRYIALNEIIRENSQSHKTLDFGCLSSAGQPIAPGSLFGAASVPYFRISRNNLFWPLRIKP